MTDKVPIRQLRTNVTGLDQILGGGVPEFSFNLIAGAPGSGKTTLAHEIMFALAGPGCKAVYFTVAGEPPLKMLRYQQQYEFFDPERLEQSIRFVNLSQEVAGRTLDKLFERIVAEIDATHPSLVFVDSFRAVAQAAEKAHEGPIELRHFVQRLATTMTGWQATTFLIGEYHPREADYDPVFAVADGVLWLHQSLDRNSMVRKIQVMKMRGQSPIPGFHTFRITGEGIQVFPRVIVDPRDKSTGSPETRKRLTLDNDELDQMLGGGIPAGYSVLVAGPSGSGKSVLATEFIMAGVRHDEPGVLAVFEKRPNEYSQTPPGGRAFGHMVRQGKVGVIHSRPLDLSIDETLYESSNRSSG
jgi:circadian clock protein KaiC